MDAFIKAFEDITIADLPDVGGKNASLGEMYNKLAREGIAVPDGFATTSAAFWSFLNERELGQRLKSLLSSLDTQSLANLKEIGQTAREMILSTEIPSRISGSILDAYHRLTNDESLAVAVRSSATAEDLPNASFAGQHESYLNITGDQALLDAVHRCYASLYTDRAIKYRLDNGFDHGKIALSIGIQYMVRSGDGCSGVAFTIDPESGFTGIVHISGVWGLGENLVQGTVNPDEFWVFKPKLIEGKQSIINRRLGDKAYTLQYDPRPGSSSTINLPTSASKRHQFILSDGEVTQLAAACLVIERHYKKPMDIEWARDGITNKIFIIQARPETVQASRNPTILTVYKLLQSGTPIASGLAIGTKAATGIARVLDSAERLSDIKKGDIVITNSTTPDWDPILKNVAGIVTNQGGRTSHASIVARELGVPAIVGCLNATERIKDGETITIACCEGTIGKVYQGQLPINMQKVDLSTIKRPRNTKVMLITGSPENAFQYSFYPCDGVGLMRMEFIINHSIQIHPMALAKFDTLQDTDTITKIENLTPGYTDKKFYFVQKLAEGIATMAAAMYPREVIVRMSDFKTNEYAHLIGGSLFEPSEENPMIGFRGASRYYHPMYKEGFALECAAINMVRKDMGLTNVKIMIPFCRTIEEGKKVVAALSDNFLDRDHDAGLKIYVMAEIPSNVLLAEEFARIFDGFSIGSNDLTQLTLGIDRDSPFGNALFNEKDPAVKMLIGSLIDKAKQANVPVGLCGQAPSDDPNYAKFLIEKGITSISFNADALLAGIATITAIEDRQRPVVIL